MLKVALPLVVSTGAHSLQMFADTVFLNWHSRDAMSASMPGGLWSFVFVSFFMGTASYVNTFVAQYHGAGRPERIGRALWQSIYFAIASGLLILLTIPLAPTLFRWVGHAPKIQVLEVLYFRILIGAGLFSIYSSALSAFFTGMGRTRVVMWVTLATTALNTVLNYLWIFGYGGFPAWGLAGAAWATFAAIACNALLFTILIFSPRNRREFATWANRAFDRDLFRRLLRYGLPNGFQFSLDMVTFTLFCSLVGRLGELELAATVMAFRINLVGFLPMIGLSIAVSTLVGQRLGENRPDLAQYATWSTFHIGLVYALVVCIAYVLLPDLVLAPFGIGAADAAEFAEAAAMVYVLLRFVAAYSLFDMVQVVFAGTLKGAGDTHFVMRIVTILGFGLMVAPTWWMVRTGSGGLYGTWVALSVYVSALALVFYLRFQGGKWREMRVIEAAPVPLDAVASPESEPPPM